MKICDRCQNRGHTTLAVEQITFASTDEKKDLCKSCLEDVREFISCKPAELKQAIPFEQPNKYTGASH